MPKNQSGPARAARELGPLLLSLCRRDGLGPASEADLRLLDDGETRARFLDYALAHGVLGLALGRLARLRGGALAGTFRDRLHDCRRRAAVLELARDRVLAIVRAEGLE